MKTQATLRAFASSLLSGAAISAIASTGAFAQSIGDEIIVTSQRTEQSLQDVPIAVSAFSGADLQDRQLETFQDIQFNIPNFAFSRSNFTGSTIVLRGIGALAVGASTEPAVSIHLNDVFISAPRLFETEFFDIERLEILRGPQGTLFGRNATGGVVNVHTAKASVDEVGGYVDAEYGNFNSVKLQGALNIPLTERLAFRLAGTTIQRDGFTENVFDGSDIDDRNIYALRASTRWLPTDNTTVDFTANYMRESDSRNRYQKRACNSGPDQFLLGCSPDGPRQFSPQDLRGTFFANASAEALGIVTGNPAAGAFGLFSISQPQFGEAQPEGLRQVNQDFTPQYDAEETIFLVNAKHDFENFSVKFNAGWGNSKIATRTDFDGGVGPVINLPAALATLPGVAALYSGGVPLSDFDLGIEGPNNGLVGLIGGNIQSRSDRFQAVDLSIGETDYWSVEGIVSSNFDGRFNFLLGANYSDSNGYADYAVATTGLDYFSVLVGTLSAQNAAGQQAAAAVLGGGGTPLQAQAAAQAAAAAVGAQGFSLYTPYFFNDTDDGFTESLSFFGEAYVDITDTFKFIGGFRYNLDDKGVRDRGNLLESASTTNPGILAGTPGAVPLGTPSVRPLLDSNELVEGTPGAVNDFRVVEDSFNAPTGRAVLQWTPTDNSQYYVSYTRGYKAGGFNPRTTSAEVPLTFEPENINAYEIGAKLSLFDSTLRANLTGFYYDYSGLQVSRIVANTSVNENINATVYGVEGEFVWQPTDRWTLNMNASYLNTDIGEFATIDVRDPLGDSTGNTLLADLTNGSNCVLLNNGAPPLIGQSLPGPLAALNPLIASPFTVCSAFNAPSAALGGATPLQVINGAFGTNYQLVSGIEQSVTGNQLPGSSEFKVAGGIQYELPTGNGYMLTPRVDAYWQSEQFTNIFNTEKDRINGYAYVNAQIKFGPEDGFWTVRAFVQNLTGSNATTGLFDAGQGAGNFQNVFLLEPRRYGFGLNVNF